MKYRTIYADPPWNEAGGGKIKRGADRHYPLMKTPEIIELMKEVLDGKVDQENGCHIYLWVTNNFLQDGFEVLEALGFEYITMITWGKERMGLGQYYRGMTEHCLFGATKKRPSYRTLPNGKRAQGKTLFIERKGRHSEKPEQMRQWIEQVSHGPRLEIFARDQFEGWDVWGNEVNNEESDKKTIKNQVVGLHEFI